MKPRTKLTILAAGLVAAAAVYTGAWFYLAGRLEDHANAFIASLTGKHVDAACTRLEVGGFPFEIGLRCDAVRAKDTRDGATIDAGAFRSAAQFGRPGHVVSRLQGPLRVSAPDGSTVEADWQMLGSSTVFWNDGLTRGDFQTKQFRATVDGPLVPARLNLQAAGMEAHTRQNKGDLDAAFTVDRLAVRGAGLPVGFPLADVSGNATLDGMGRLLHGGSRVSARDLRGSSGTLHALTAKLGSDATLSARGPFSFDASGRLNGKFKIRIADLDAWEKAVAQILPQARKTLADATGMLKMLAGRDGAVSMTLTARDGELMLGIVPIAKIPPV